MTAREGKAKLKMLVGLVLSKTAPERTRRIEQAFTLPYWNRSREGGPVGRFAGRMIRFYLANRANAESSGVELEQIHKRFWRHQLDASWYESEARAFEREALPRLEPMVRRFAELLRGSSIDTVCEIGTGNGKFIAYLRDTLHQATPWRFIGLDLSSERMALNRTLYHGIEFVAGDASEWILQHSANNTLYVTSGGVLEYLSQRSLEAILGHIARTQDGSAIALFNEPLAPDHDVERDLQSRLTSAGEFSFSHNYPYLLREASFVICHQQDDDAAGWRGMTLLARAPSPRDRPVGRPPGPTPGR